MLLMLWEISAVPACLPACGVACCVCNGLQGTAVLKGNFDPKSLELVLSTLQVMDDVLLQQPAGTSTSCSINTSSTACHGDCGIVLALLALVVSMSGVPAVCNGLKVCLFGADL
jgi:hypothetical protein